MEAVAPKLFNILTSLSATKSEVRFEGFATKNGDEAPTNIGPLMAIFTFLYMEGKKHLYGKKVSAAAKKSIMKTHFPTKTDKDLQKEMSDETKDFTVQMSTWINVSRSNVLRNELLQLKRKAKETKSATKAPKAPKAKKPKGSKKDKNKTAEEITNNNETTTTEPESTVDEPDEITFTLKGPTWGENAVAKMEGLQAQGLVRRNETR
jgi:hypothetical protein